jgi:hypothetical protein
MEICCRISGVRKKSHNRINFIRRIIMNNNTEQILKVVKWTLRAFIFAMIIIIINDFSTSLNIPSDIGSIKHSIVTLLHVLILGLLTYGLVHYKEL